MAADTQPSTTTQDSQQNPQQLEPWPKSELESSLAHLERLQHQIDHLRSAIPDLVRPLQTQTHSPRTKADALLDVRKVAVRRAEDLRTFGEIWSGEETKRILERARESEERDGDLERCGEVQRWGWIEKVEEEERVRSGEGIGS